VLAAYTILPVIGVPIKSDALDGMDALLSIAQMPPGIPVATVAINGGENAAVLAAQILQGEFPEISDKLVSYKKQLAEKVAAKDKAMQEKILKLKGLTEV
ncbi:MAG: AIR carboxylase family protein, partial [Clostridiales bacterium]|nr:AIR carboxylase family protein [Clostridiales bacterium]